MTIIRQGAPAGSLVRAGTNRERALRLLCWALFATAAQAEARSEESFPQVWLNPGVYSYHFDSSKGLRNNNIGLGAEVRLTHDHGLMAGTFINSHRQRSHYATYQWRPLHWRWADLDIGAGISVGAFDGYPKYRNGGWFLAPLPVLAIEGRRFGVNISVIPTLAMAVQVKMRVW